MEKQLLDDNESLSFYHDLPARFFQTYNAAAGMLEIILENVSSNTWNDQQSSRNIMSSSLLFHVYF